MTITACDEFLSSDIQGVNCDNKMYGKYKNVCYIWNKEDLALSTPDGANGFKITALTMKSGRAAFQAYIPTSTPFPTTITLVKGAASNKFNKTVQLSLQDNSPDFIQNVIEPLTSGGRFVAMLIHEREGEGRYEIFGFEKGLEAADGTSREEYSEDTDGGWNVQLEEMGAPSPAVFFWDTDEATTAAAVTALLTPAV